MKNSLGLLCVYIGHEWLMVRFLCFRNVAGWLPVDLPGVHVHQWPLPGSFGTISLLENTCTNIALILLASTLPFIVPLTTSTYSSTRCRGQEEGKDALFRKRKVLQLVSHWSRLYKDFLKEEEHVRSFMKVWYQFFLSFYKNLTSLILCCSFICVTEELWRSSSSSFIFLSYSNIGLSCLKTEQCFSLQGGHDDVFSFF